MKDGFIKVTNGWPEIHVIYCKRIEYVVSVTQEHGVSLPGRLYDMFWYLLFDKHM